MKPITAVDDIDTGGYVVVVSDRYQEPAWSDFRQAPPIYNGIPLKVLSIDPPFIYVTSPFGDDCTLDLRAVCLVKPGRTWVNTWNRQYRNRRKNNSNNTGFLIATSSRKVHQCPRCGGSLVERMTAGGPWLFVCDECGYSTD